MNILNQFDHALSNFLFASSFTELSAISLASGLPMAVTGNGGNAKSSMTEALLSCFDESVTKWVHSLNEDFSADDVFGGIDFAALTRKDNPNKEYLINESMFMSHISVLEEGFDARPKALASMKDALTSGFIRMGRTQVKVVNRWMIVLSNRSTSELSEMGASIEALMQRFLVMEQEDSFETEQDIERLLKISQDSKKPEFDRLITMKDIYNLQDHTQLVWVEEPVQKLLAHLLHEARRSGNSISPRSMVRCQLLVKASAAIDGRDTANDQDLRAIKWIDGTQGVISDLDREIAKQEKIRSAEYLLTSFSTRFEELKMLFSDYSKPESAIKYLKVVKGLKSIEAQMSGFSCPDSMTSRRDDLRKKIASLISEAQDKALEVTNA